MARFFIDPSAVERNTNKITITGEDVNHIKNVLRAAQGDKLILSDGSGSEYSARIDAFEKDRITASIVEVMDNITEPPVDVVLFQGIPKSDKMDTIIQKSVELGVRKIFPVITERTVVRLDNAKDMGNKTARWRRISLEAAKQCNRGIVPLVETPMKLEKAFEVSGEFALRLIPYENEKDTGLKKYLGQGVKGGICVFIGPEGGFSENEIESARSKGIKPVTLGPRILRTETAGPAVLSILMYELGDIGK